MNISPSEFRILVCFLIGLMIVGTGLSYAQSGDLVMSVYSPFFVAMGILVVMFGFVPSLGKAIINALVSMLKLITKMLSSMLRMH